MPPPGGPVCTLDVCKLSVPHQQQETINCPSTVCSPDPVQLRVLSILRLSLRLPWSVAIMSAWLLSSFHSSSQKQSWRQGFQSKYFIGKDEKL